MSCHTNNCHTNFYVSALKNFIPKFDWIETLFLGCDSLKMDMESKGAHSKREVVVTMLVRNDVILEHNG